MATSTARHPTYAGHSFANEPSETESIERQFENIYSIRKKPNGPKNQTHTQQSSSY